MSNQPTSQERILDKNGRPVSGAKVYYYAAGTTTDETVYTTAARSVAHSQPVSADSQGYLPPVFLTPDTAYRRVVKNYADTLTLQDTDNLYSSIPSSDAPATRRREVTETPLDQDSTLNSSGGADVATEIQAMITAALTAPGVSADLIGGTWRVDSQIAGGSGLRLRNGVLDFSNASATELLTLHGTLGSVVALTGDAAYLDETLTVASTSGLSQGDLLEVTSSALFAGDEEGGELVEVDSAAGFNINLKGPLDEQYTTGNSAEYRKMTACDDVVLENLKIIAPEAGSGTTMVTLSVKNARRVVIRNCHFEGIDDGGAALRIAGCDDVLVEGCTFEASESTTGYGVIVLGACRNIRIRECSFACEFGVATNQVFDQATITCAVGQVRDLWVTDNFMDTEAEAVYLDQDTLNVRVQRNRIKGGGTANAIYVECLNVDISDNSIMGAGNNGIVIDNLGRITTSQDSQDYWFRINRNEIEGDSASGIAWTSAAATLGADIELLEVCGNTMDGAISFTSIGSQGADFYLVRIHGNQCRSGDLTWNGGSSRKAFALEITSNYVPGITVVGTSNNIDSLRVEDNHLLSGDISVTGALGGPVSVCRNWVNNATATAITVTNTNPAHLMVNDNKIEGSPTTWGISVAIDDWACISGNIISTTDGGGIYVAEAGTVSGLVVRGNIVECTDAGIKLDNFDSTDLGLIVANNSVMTSTSTAGEHAFDFQSGGCNGLVVSGNYFQRTDTGEDVVHIEGSGAGALQGVVISGNTIRGGDYGLVVTQGNANDVLHVGNSYLDVSQATPYTGTMTTANIIDN